MLLNFREIQRQVQAKIQNTNDSVENANDLLPKIKDWINDRYARLYRSFFFQEIIESYDLTLTASVDEYVFDRDVEPGNILSIFDKTNGVAIEEDTIQNHNRLHAPYLEKTGNIVTDNPTRYRLTGVYTVKVETYSSAGEKVNIVSTNASDISPNVVRVEGLVGGVRIGEEIVLTGTTSAISTNIYDASQKLTISVGTNDGTAKTIQGKITVSGATSLSVFAQLSPDEYAHKYQWFKVSPKPKSSGTQPTWEIWYKKAFRRLDNDTDVPLFDCSIELVQGAFADALREDGLEGEASAAENTFISMVKELQSTRQSSNIIDQFRPTYRDKIKIVQDAYNWLP
jgi:hypothetical protein